MVKFEVMATTERDGETVFLPIFYIEAENASQARLNARIIIGGNPSVAVISESGKASWRQLTGASNFPLTR
jgi:hypothetical protein